MNQANDPTNCMNKINRLLPPEMLERILSQLEPKDLKNAMLVCKLWAKVETMTIAAFTPFISWGLSSFILFSIIQTLISTLIFCSFTLSNSLFTFLRCLISLRLSSLPYYGPGSSSPCCCCCCYCCYCCCLCCCPSKMVAHVSGWRVSIIVDLGPPNLGKEELGSNDLDQVAPTEEGSGWPSSLTLGLKLPRKGRLCQ